MSQTAPDNTHEDPPLCQATESRSNPGRAGLWFQLRNRRFEGLKFRRQLPVGPYIVDFVCLDQRLVIEVDGSQHNQLEDQLQDEARTAYLAREGFRVIRVWNNDVMGRMDAVLAFIRQSLL